MNVWFPISIRPDSYGPAQQARLLRWSWPHYQALPRRNPINGCGLAAGRTKAPLPCLVCETERSGCDRVVGDFASERRHLASFPEFGSVGRPDTSAFVKSPSGAIYQLKRTAFAKVRATARGRVRLSCQWLLDSEQKTVTINIARSNSSGRHKGRGSGPAPRRGICKQTP